MSTVDDDAAVPYFPAGVRLHRELTHGRWVLLAPERVVELDETARAVLVRIDGASNVATIVSALAAEYDVAAAQVRGDVRELFDTLIDKRLLAFAATP